MKALLNRLFAQKLFDDNEINSSRIYFIILCFALFYFIIFVKLFNVTIWDHFFDNGSYGASSNKSAFVLKRADIVDRNGELLAINLATTSVYVNPKIIIDPKVSAQKLASALDKVKYEDVLKKITSGKSFVWIKREVSPKEEQRVNDLGLPGVYFEFGEKRAYPKSNLVAHALGYSGLDGKGLAGIENYFDAKLRYRKNENYKEPLRLSIDIRAQNIIREELAKAINEFSAKGGVGILQDANTGEIISMVSLPDYDPHHPSKALDETLFNKATLGIYELGSIFKLFTVATALDSGAVNLNYVYDIEKPIIAGGHKISDFRGKGGWRSIPEILMYSSNIGVSQIAMEMGKEKQIDYFKRLGFLSPLEVELKEKSSPTYTPFSKWTNVNVMAASYGYGISVSPLHITKAMSAIVNGGRLIPPTLLKQSFNSKLTPLEKDYKQVLSSNTSRNMRKLLRMIVKYGSANKADVSGFFVGGKSGTANKVVDGKYRENLRISSFLSAFPMHNPKYVMLISLDEPVGKKSTFGFATGSWVAAPATARIIERLSPVLGVIPDHENQEIIDKELFLEYKTPDNKS